MFNKRVGVLILLLAVSVGVIGTSAKADISFVTVESESKECEDLLYYKLQSLPENVLHGLQREVKFSIKSDEVVKGDWNSMSNDSKDVLAYYTYTRGSSTNKNTDRSIVLRQDYSGLDEVLHEVGHYIDERTGNPSNSEQFRDLFTKYSQYFGAYAMTSKEECFATMYKDCITYPEYVISIHPDIYGFVMEKSRRINSEDPTMGNSVGL